MKVNKRNVYFTFTHIIIIVDSRFWQIRVNEWNRRWQRQTERGWEDRHHVRWWCESPRSAVMRMRMWLRATGFAGNWFNECILLPLIEHMPCVHSSRSHTHVVIVSSCSLAKFRYHLVSQRGDVSTVSWSSYTVSSEGQTDSSIEERKAITPRLFLLAFLRRLLIYTLLLFCVCVYVCVV